jgi:hypothetical protein
MAFRATVTIFVTGNEFLLLTLSFSLRHMD